MNEEETGPEEGAEEISAPETPETGNTEPVSSRQAIENAFAKVEAPEDLTAEDTAEQPAEGDEANKGPDRDEKGRFKSKAEQAATDAAAVEGEGAPELKAEGEEAAKVEPVTLSEAFDGLADETKTAVAALPEGIRADVERRFGELTAGIEKYKSGAEAFESVAKYDEQARASGTTLDAALQAYTGMEERLKTDPLAGLFQICHNTGIDPTWAVQAMAQAIHSNHPAMNQAPPQQQPQTPPETSNLAKEVEGLKATISQGQVQAQIDKFAADKPYFSDLEDSIAEMLETGFAKDLSAAYDKALLLNPEVAAKIEADKKSQDETVNKKPPPDPAQTREKAALSTTGAPSAGSSQADRKPPGSSREALSRAFEQVGMS